MKRIVLVLDLAEDEARLIETAVSGSDVRFGGLTLDALLQLSRDGAPASGIGTEVSFARSEGSTDLGGPPLATDGLLRNAE